MHSTAGLGQRYVCIREVLNTTSGWLLVCRMAIAVASYCYTRFSSEL